MGEMSEAELQGQLRTQSLTCYGARSLRGPGDTTHSQFCRREISELGSDLHRKGDELESDVDRIELFRLTLRFLTTF